jgi:hypothetical protein
MLPVGETGDDARAFAFYSSVGGDAAACGSGVLSRTPDFVASSAEK